MFEKKLLEGFTFGIGLFLALSLLGTVFAIGFHIADEILPGTFTGNYTFDGNVNITTGNDLCLESGNCLSTSLASESDPTVLNSVKDGVSWSEITGKPAGLDGIDAGDSGASNYLYMNTDTYFYRDTANRIRTPNTLYVDSNSANTYLYSTNTYLGASSGDNIHIRGNTLDGTNFRISSGELRVSKICDENGNNCNDMSSGLGSGLVLGDSYPASTTCVYSNHAQTLTPLKLTIDSGRLKILYEWHQGSNTCEATCTRYYSGSWESCACHCY